MTPAQRKHNREAFSALFESIGGVLCVVRTSPLSVDAVSALSKDFVESASLAGGECLDIGINVMSRIMRIPSVAFEEEINNYKSEHERNN